MSPKNLIAIFIIAFFIIAYLAICQMKKIKEQRNHIRQQEKELDGLDKKFRELFEPENK